MEEKKADKFEEEEQEEYDGKCGYFCWTPRWLQRFNHPRILLLCVCWSTFTQGFVINGINNVNVSTLERRYDLSSSSVAWISSSYDVSAGLFSLIFGYIAMFHHLGKIIGLSCLVMAAGSFTMFLPHLLGGIYELGPRPTEICDLSDNRTDPCADYDGGGSSYLPVFIFGQLLHGVGGAAIYTLAIPYMDSNIKRKNTALYIGIMQAFAALGPALGFAVGGFILTIYVDTGRTDPGDIDLTPSDPRWVGAWWIGFLYGGFANITVALLMLCFPRELPTGVKYKNDLTSEAYKGSGESTEDSKRTWRTTLISFKNIMTNPTFLFITIGAIFENSAVMAFATFLPKVIQFQFSQSLLMAGILAGSIVIPGACGGQILGGLVPRWLNLRLRGMVAQCMVMSLLSVFLIFQFLLRCNVPKIAGISAPYFNRSLELVDGEQEVYHPCNIPCNCTTQSYDPICGEDGMQYFTPCHGGCQEEVEINGDKGYLNCSCMGERGDFDQVPDYLQASPGICDESCSVLPLFCVLFFFINVTTFMSATTGQAATLRCVPEKEKAFAFGLQATLVRYLGQVPGPILLGAIFDDSCWLWQETCGDRGSCWIYDTNSLAEGITFLGLIIKGVSFISFLLALVLYRPPPTQIIDEKEIGNETKETSSNQNETGQNSTDTKTPESLQSNGTINLAFSSEEDIMNTRL